MLKDITIGQYIPGETCVHKLDPRVKIIISFIFLITLFIINNLVGYIVPALVLVVVIILAKIKLRYIYNGLKPVFILILITAIINMFFGEGKTILFSIGRVNIYKESLEIALLMVIRITFLIISTSLVTLTTSPIELTDGLEKLLNPLKRFKVPAHELAMMMTIALRFIPTLIDETDKIMKAQMARGADLESGNLINKVKNLIPILVPLFISSFKRADELAMAMEARCYKGGEGRTRMKVLKLHSGDLVALVATVLFVVVSFWSRHWSGYI